MAKTHTIGDDVKAVLKNTETQGNVAYLPKDLERGLYQRTNKILTALGGRWDRTQGGHYFSECPAEKIADAVTTGSVANQQQEFQDFPTPDPICCEMVIAACLHPEHRVLEPSCGSGGLVRCIVKHHCAPLEKVICFEAQKRHWEDMLAEFGSRVDMRGDDFLQHYPQEGEGANRILMNPPFYRGTDIKHWLHAWTFWLQPGGIQVAIMSPSFTYARTQNAEGMRTALLEETSIEPILRPLPAGTFKGTDVETVLVIATKARQ